MTSIVEEFKVDKGRLVVTLKQSTDDLIRKAGIETRTRRKWSASQAVSQAESCRERDNAWATQNHNAGPLQVRKRGDRLCNKK